MWAAPRLKINDDGFYTLSIGAADMGTGCDTILAQIAAEVLECPLDNMTVFGADTDSSPYDSGSYASSTTYVTGKAVEKCALSCAEDLSGWARSCWALTSVRSSLTGDAVTSEDGTQRATLARSPQPPSAAAIRRWRHRDPQLGDFAPAVHGGRAEVEVDLETGEAQVML